MASIRDQVGCCSLARIALMLMLLAGCGSESPRTPPAPPPAPFQPTVVVVDLGTRGGKTTLVSTSGGGWTRNGTAITSGTVVRGENGADYRLTLANGSWSAEFVTPDPVSVDLGTSGGTVMLQALENGSFELDGTVVSSGRVVSAQNGNRYRLVLGDDSRWEAVFVAPPATTIRLGASVFTVTVRTREDGSYELDGERIRSGKVVTTAVGSTYRLLLGAGAEWTAEFVPPDPTTVALGNSGDSVRIEIAENRTYLLDGQQLSSGQVRTVANNRRYRFQLSPNGKWTATYVPETVVVQLGFHGGTITLTRSEDGSHRRGETVFRSGTTVTGTNRHEYRLTLGRTGWRADPLPLVITIELPGTAGSIAVTQFEDGTYYYSGEQIQSDETVTVNGIAYVLTLSGTSGSARRQAGAPPDPGRPSPPSGSLISDTLTTYLGSRPRLRDADGSGTREGSRLEINGKTYALNDLYPSGSVEDAVSFAKHVRNQIESLLSTFELLASLYEANASGLESRMESDWDRIRTHLNSLFPGQGQRLLAADVPKRGTGGSRLDTAEALLDIRDVLTALNSVADFEDALDDGIFRYANLDDDDVYDVFATDRSVDNVSFGSTANTRFGAYSKRRRSRLTSSLSLVPGAEGLGKFAYSPLDRARTADLPRDGTAWYRGGTVAASGQGNYEMVRGLFDLSVRFSTKLVSGEISELTDSSGQPWTYSAREVATITLPNARLHSSNGSFTSSTGARGTVNYTRVSTRLPAQTLTADYAGRFLDTDTATSEAVLGTWEIRRGTTVVLTGAFGAEYDTVNVDAVRLPTPMPPDLNEAAQTSLIAGPDRNGDITIAALDSDGDRIKLSAEQLIASGEQDILGRRHFAIATEQIQRQLELLQLYIRLEDDSSTIRNTLWSRANMALRDHVFGPTQASALGSSYPSSLSGRVRDENAVERLEDSVTALSSLSLFIDSLDEDGVFDGLLGSRLDNYDFNAIYDAREYEVQSRLKRTGYTRFGAWTKSQRSFAVSTNRNSSLPAGEAPNVFAYSPQEQVAYSTNDQRFPGNSRGTYTGQTVAVDRSSSEPTFYDGDVTLTVEWGRTPNGSAVSLVVSDLVESATATPFRHNGHNVDDIVYTRISTRSDANRKLGFSTSSPTVRIEYSSLARRDASFSGKRAQQGKFVGLSLLGPLGVIGTWELGDIKGAYGADLVP